MAYDGPIVYIEVPFGKVQWASDSLDLSDWKPGLSSSFFPGVNHDGEGGSIHDAWRHQGYSTPLLPAAQHSERLLSALVRKLSLTPHSHGIVFDTEDESHNPLLRCVVLGWDKYCQVETETRYYVLVVKLDDQGQGRYHRVGAGIASHVEISSEAPERVSVV
jgi:hypothetical protein